MNPAKRHRLNNGIRELNLVSRNMKLNDLNIDCIEEIFERLSLNDLLGVADTTIRCRHVAQLVFDRKYEKFFVSIGKEKIRVEHENGHIFELQTKGLITSFRFLRCFGPVISDIYICFENFNQSDCDELLRYLNEYCAETVISLYFRHSDDIIINNIYKQFANVKYITLDGSTLGGNLTNFNKWFPQLQHLYISENIILNPQCIESHFPHLIAFQYISSGNEQLNKDFQMENLAVFVRLNAQLKRITFMDSDWKLIRVMSEHLPQLETLDFAPTETEYEQKMKKITSTAPIRFRNVKHFDISLDLDSPHSFPINSLQFDQLESFTVEHVEFNDLWNFVNKHSSIMELTINDVYTDELDLNVENFLQIVNVLPLLCKFSVHSQLNGFTVNEAVRFVVEIKHLEQFNFEVNDIFEVRDLERRLGSEWQVKQSNGCVFLQRKYN